MDFFTILLYLKTRSSQSEIIQTIIECIIIISEREIHAPFYVTGTQFFQKLAKMLLSPKPQSTEPITSTDKLCIFVIKNKSTSNSFEYESSLSKFIVSHSNVCLKRSEPWGFQESWNQSHSGGEFLYIFIGMLLTPYGIKRYHPELCRKISDSQYFPSTLRIQLVDLERIRNEFKDDSPPLD